ncbi:AzlC family ABC transporter permease [Ferrovibrio sp.]|uniref:AzlC family ABC transporter permease n=1 Tax=Ferrovibrio sp. TaxID=1917215 RepID=UPI003D2C08D2
MPPTTPQSLRLTWRGALEGARVSAGLVPGVFIYAVAFGVLARTAETGLTAAFLMSALVFTGSGQVVSLQLWHAPFPILAMLATIFAMNARYVLMSASLRPALAGMPTSHAYASLFMLGDGNWIMAMRMHAQGNLEGGFLFGSGATQYLVWCAGTVLGYLAGSLLGSPKSLGLDFLLTAFCTAMAVAMWKGRDDAWPLLVGGGSAILAAQVIPGQWYIVIGAITGSVFGAFWKTRKPASADA